MADDEQKSNGYNVVGKMALAVVFHGLVLLALLGVAAFVIPRFQVVFDQMGSDLPAVTRVALRVCDFIRSYWYAYLLGAALFLAGDAVIYLGACRYAGGSAAVLWFMLVLLAQVIPVVLILVGVCLPLITMITEVSE